MKHIRRLAAAAMALCLAAVLALTQIGLASASDGSTGGGLVTCPAGAQSSRYTPGLRLIDNPPTVHVHTEGDLGLCVPLDLIHTGGTFVLDGNGPLSCVSGRSAGSGTIYWSTAGTHPSHYVYEGVITLRPDGVSVNVETGTITSGDYTGATLVMSKVVASLNLTACLTEQGLTSTSGPVNLTLA